MTKTNFGIMRISETEETCTLSRKFVKLYQLLICMTRMCTGQGIKAVLQNKGNEMEELVLTHLITLSKLNRVRPLLALTLCPIRIVMIMMC